MGANYWKEKVQFCWWEDRLVEAEKDHGYAQDEGRYDPEEAGYGPTGL